MVWLLLTSLPSYLQYLPAASAGSLLLAFFPQTHLELTDFRSSVCPLGKLSESHVDTAHWATSTWGSWV